MTSVDHGRTRRTTALAFVLFGIVVAEIVTAVVGAATAGLGVADVIDGFVVTNLAIGMSCGVAGLLIGWQRPRNPVGWLLLAAGLCQSATAAVTPFMLLGARQGWSEPVLRTLMTVFSYAWPWSIVLFLPLALLAFPDGLLPGRFWRAVAWFAVLASPVFVLATGADPAGATFGRAPIVPWLVLPAYSQLEPLWIASEIANIGVLLVAVVGLVVRYRRGDEQRRRQLLWLLLALVGMIVIIVPWALFDAGPILQLLAIALVPAAMTIAVLRHQLLDIRLVLSRTRALRTAHRRGRRSPTSGSSRSRTRCCARARSRRLACWPRC